MVVNIYGVYVCRYGIIPERDIGSGNGIDVAYIDKEKGYNEINDQVIAAELKKIGKEL
ncbi:MAG: hypothetical protein HWN65_09950 [Candidatus Helarchaeota archaeon]|nr:hypothetical protein [Candidatus Helarchaeota archaeon]